MRCLLQVPLVMYLMTHAYFCFYHAISNLVLRRVRVLAAVSTSILSNVTSNFALTVGQAATWSAMESIHIGRCYAPLQYPTHLQMTPLCDAR